MPGSGASNAIPIRTNGKTAPSTTGTVMRSSRCRAPPARWSSGCPLNGGAPTLDINGIKMRPTAKVRKRVGQEQFYLWRANLDRRVDYIQGVIEVLDHLAPILISVGVCIVGAHGKTV